MTDPTVKPATPNQIRSEQLVERLFQSADFSTRAAVVKTAKELFPGLQLPEDNVAPVIEPLRKEIDDLKAMLADRNKRDAEREEKDAEAKTFSQLESAVNKAVDKFKLSDEGRAAMLDRMKETKNFTDIEAAAAWVAHSKPPQPTAGPSWASTPGKMNLFGSAEADDKYKKLHMNPEGFLEGELYEFARDPDKYVADTFGQSAR